MCACLDPTGCVPSSHLSIIISHLIATRGNDAAPTPISITVGINITYFIAYSKLALCLFRYSRDSVERQFSTISGFNVGLNAPEGRPIVTKTVDHCENRLLFRDR